MILLEPENTLIRDLLSKHFIKSSFNDQTLTDFDGVRYHVESSKTGPLSLSMSINCWKELNTYGATQVLSREYGSYIRPDTEAGYDVTLHFTPDTIPKDDGECSNCKIAAGESNSDNSSLCGRVHRSTGAFGFVAQEKCNGCAI